MNGVPKSAISEREHKVGKRGMLSPSYTGSYGIKEKGGYMAYRLVMPSKLEGISPVFHVSMLGKKCGKRKMKCDLDTLNSLSLSVLLKFEGSNFLRGRL